MRSEVVVEPCRQYAQAAVTTLQLLLISTRGHRAYTSNELNIIFKTVGVEFFKNLEQLAQYLQQRQFNYRQREHVRDPTNNPAPVAWSKEKRDDGESDSESTDDETRFAGLGKFEYSRKGLAHALQHAPQAVEEGGHHAATCTTVSEMGHRDNLKLPAKFARTYLSKNVSQAGMLKWTLHHKLLKAIFKRNKTKITTTVMSSDVSDPDDSNYVLRTPLKLTETWSRLRCPGGRTPVSWGRTFMSKDILVSRDEVVTFLRTKLNLTHTWGTTVKLVKDLTWECFGTAQWIAGRRRTVVGVSRVNRRRRDFVRLEGFEDNTALGAQVPYKFTHNLISALFFRIL